MSAPARIAGFLSVLTLAFAGAALAGAAIDPAPPEAGDPDAHATAAAGAGHATGAGHGTPDAVRGLGVAADGLRLAVPDPELPRGERATLRFSIVDRDGSVVRDLDLTHERRMHLIVVRRDLARFQHVHPVQAADGSWSVVLKLDAAGSYRMLADFGHAGEAYTLGADLRVDGAATLAELPAPVSEVRTDGYEVRLDAAAARAGAETALRFAISRDGEPVRTQPYLGAAGHLVALREGDLAFLHVHPEGDEVAFATSFPSDGRYRLYLQFRHAGRVHTAAFTQVVGR
jgi:hypothetical protein